MKNKICLSILILAFFALFAPMILFKTETPSKPIVVKFPPDTEISLDYSKLVGIYEDEAECRLHNVSYKGHIENHSPPHENIYKIKDLTVKLAIVNDRVIGVSIGDMNWMPKEGN